MSAPISWLEDRSAGEEGRTLIAAGSASHSTFLRFSGPPLTPHPWGVYPYKNIGLIQAKFVLWLSEVTIQRELLFKQQNLNMSEGQVVLWGHQLIPTTGPKGRWRNTISWEYRKNTNRLFLLRLNLAESRKLGANIYHMWSIHTYTDRAPAANDSVCSLSYYCILTW